MITIYGATDQGLVRKVNQDRYACGVLGEELAWAVLCDGMGGPAGGHVASETATGFVGEMFSRDLAPGMNEGSLRSVMLSAAAGANSLVYDAARREPELAGMGTTLILAVFWEAHLYVAYVGDSRVYWVRGEEERQLTRDHTVVQMLLDIGEISQEDAQTHPKRHFITRAVGVAPMVDADFMEHEFMPGDIALLCSDGLYSYLQPECLPGLVRRCLDEQSVQSLIELAKAGGGGDNITAVLVYRAPEKSAPPAEEPPVYPEDTAEES